MITKSGKKIVFCIAPLCSWQVGTDLHPVHSFPDLVKMMSRAEGLQSNIC